MPMTVLQPGAEINVLCSVPGPNMSKRLLVAANYYGYGYVDARDIQLDPREAVPAACVPS
ncbi:hypothetical protein SAMN05442782_1091 [Streptomyces sp. OK228]|nr:hypothetical protein SAMN05442782_1091 [Streptomyces sp. OK228]